MDRTTGGLAEDVPAGDLDGRDGRHVDLAALGVDVAHHALEEQLDVRSGRARATASSSSWMAVSTVRAEGVERALADPVDAFVGVDPDEQPVLPGVAHEVGVTPVILIARSSRQSQAHPPRRGLARRQPGSDPGQRAGEVVVRRGRGLQGDLLDGGVVDRPATVGEPDAQHRRAARSQSNVRRASSGAVTETGTRRRDIELGGPAFAVT